MFGHPPNLEYLMSQLTLTHKPKKTTAIPGNFHDIPTTTPELLNKLSINTWTKLTQKTIGDDAWIAASTILIYQRQQHRDIGSARIAIKKDLECGFVLQRKEIPQLLANQRFFASCSEDFALCVSRGHNRKPWPHLSTTNGILPAKLFYEAWLMSFNYEYEDVASLARLNTISTQAFADLSLVCRIMRNNRSSQEFGCTPRNKCGLFEDYCSSGFFNISVCADVMLDTGHGNYEVNPALYLKMITQIRAMCTSLDGEFLPKVADFMLDYPKMTTAELVEKYELERGAECVAWAQLELEWEGGLVQIVFV